MGLHRRRLSDGGPDDPGTLKRLPGMLSATADESKGEAWCSPLRSLSIPRLGSVRSGEGCSARSSNIWAGASTPDLAWHSTEPNTVGVDEFTAWARRAGVEPMMAVNLGTRGVQEAVDLLEYCNVPAGTLLSDLRGSNGSPHRPPHGGCCGWARPSTVTAITERR